KKQFGELFLATKCEAGTVCKANCRRGRNTLSVFIPDGSPNKETDLLVGFFIYNSLRGFEP
ncbi:MAG: hypothetical protein IKY45_05480, partial [Clostridia bacterium]|nr:hypothetical protein [Clostridia bacterium]